MLQIYAIPALETNYFWLLQPSSDSSQAYILDPGDAQPVLDTIAQHQLELAGIIITHHHWDHTDGINDLLARHSIPVYGPASRRIPQITHFVKDGDTLELPDLRLKVLAVPGHTLDHIAYFHDDQITPHLFCGDTLFAGGCGRLFEGSPEQMYRSLQTLAALPEQTLVYCSHEYTVANLTFAQMVEPDNEETRNRLAIAQDQRKRNESTLPSNIRVEKCTNPFLRCHLPDIKTVAEQRAGYSLATPADVFATIRRWKDQS